MNHRDTEALRGRRGIAGAFVACLALCVFAPPSAAQQPREELLRLVPKDFGLCVVVSDLRGYAERWDRSAWLEKLKSSPLGKALVESSEWRDLVRFQKELKKHLGLDWASLRDDILGDAVVFAFQPAPGNQAENDQGVLLLHARQPALLKALLERLDKLQQQNGELKQLQTKQHRGMSYVVRVGTRNTHYYLLDGHVFAYAGQESLLRDIIDARVVAAKGTPPLAEDLRRAGAEKAFVALRVNPRAFDAELKHKLAQAQGGEAVLLQAFHKHWQALDSIVLSLSPAETLDLRLTLHARLADLPEGAKSVYTEAAQASTLWSYFPENAVLSIAGRADFAHLVNSLAEFAPPEVRKALAAGVQPLAGLAGLDVLDKVLPNVGPDWGFSVFAAEDPKQFPQALVALAVKPGTKETPVDQALYQGMSLLVGLAVLDYNSKHPQPIRLRTLRQDQVELKYLTSEAFPAGFSPAFALKDGFLLVATSPEAIQRFRRGAAGANRDDAPLARLSAAELAKLLRAHRQVVVSHIATRNQVDAAQAERSLDTLLSVFDLVDRLEVSRRSGGGQLAWTVRLILVK